MFGKALRFWRQTLDVSQEDLALDLGISRKHLSFLETGKSGPSKELVLAVVCVLELRERDMNNLLVAAGFAPTAPPSPPGQFGDHWREKALSIMLKGQDPKPCCVRDRYGYIKAVNRAWVAAQRAWTGDLVYEPPLNIYSLSLAESGWLPRSKNWDDFGWQGILALKQELLLAPNDQAEALYQRLIELPKVKQALSDRKQLAPSGNVYTIQMETDDKQIETWTVISTIFAEDQFVEPRLIIDTWYPRNFLPALTRGELWADRSLQHPLLYY